MRPISREDKMSSSRRTFCGSRSTGARPCDRSHSSRQAPRLGHSSKHCRGWTQRTRGGWSKLYPVTCQFLQMIGEKYYLKHPTHRSNLRTPHATAP